MQGIDQFIPRTLGANDIVMCGSIQTVGTSAGAVPAANILVERGMGRLSVVYAATGVYTFTLPPGCKFPRHAWSILVSPQAATLATDWFETIVIGNDTLDTTNPTFVVQCHRNGTANAPTNTAGNRINFWIIAGNTTGG